jgi:hypothetical protein
MMRIKSMIATCAVALLASAAGIGLGCHTGTDGMAPSVAGRDAPAPAASVPQGKSEPKTKSKAESKAEPKVEPGAEPKPAPKPAAAGSVAAQDGIDGHEFPPTIPDTASHSGDTWSEHNCLRCHETGVHGATVLRHQDMPDILLTAKCRTCHVFIPGSKPKLVAVRDKRFAKDAFPPMIPASSSHPRAWWRDDCMLCHEDGLRGAPKVIHKDMLPRLLTAKCRTCHVQVRTVSAERGARRGH